MGSSWPTSGKTSLTHTHKMISKSALAVLVVSLALAQGYTVVQTLMTDESLAGGEVAAAAGLKAAALPAAEAGCGKIGADCAAGGCCAGFKCLNIFVGHKCFPTNVDPANMTPADYADYEKFIDQYINQFIN